MYIKAPKGTRDILPEDIYKWHFVEKIFSTVCQDFGFKEIRVPVFEHTELFQRGVGDTTDIVQKEMYTFQDKGERSLTLRPEGTAGVVRSYIENGMASMVQPVKLYYNITAYRYENVQKGRYREFHQLGIEAFGSKSSLMDVEVISMFKLFLVKLGLNNIKLNINSIGCSNCRKEYIEKLKNYIRPKLEDLCGMCKDRFDKNPLRIIDCKDERCKSYVANMPSMIDNLCDECSTHFNKVKQGLDNLEIDYSVDKSIVRGLDYYTKTVFEFVSSNIGAQGTVCGGGRYDGMVSELGGVDTPGIGFATGLERLLLCMDIENVKIPQDFQVEIFIAAMGDRSLKFTQNIIYKLRQNGINAQMDTMERSLKAQMKYADKIGAKYCLVIGDDELDSNKGILKNMSNQDKKEVCLNLLVEQFKKV